MTNYRSEYEYCKRLGIDYFKEACDNYYKLEETEGLNKLEDWDFDGCRDSLIILQEWKHWMDQGFTEDEIELYNEIKFYFDENQHVFEKDFRLPFQKGKTFHMDDESFRSLSDAMSRNCEPTSVPSTYDNISGDFLPIKVVDEIEEIKMTLLHKYIGPERASEIIKLHNKYQEEKK